MLWLPDFSPKFKTIITLTRKPPLQMQWGFSYADKPFLGGGCDGVSSRREDAFDLVAQKGQNRDNNEGDQGDQKSVFNEGLALFFLQKLFHHG